jgi:hypothetical protein
MNSVEYPTVAFTIDGIRDLCSPESVAGGDNCEAVLNGRLKIRGIERPLAVPVSIASTPEGFKVRGETDIQWPDFKIEDPSILVAKLHPTVHISFSVTLCPGSGEKE